MRILALPITKQRTSTGACRSIISRGWTRAEVDLEIPAACVLLMRAPIPDRRIGHMTDASCSASRSAQQGPALTLLRRDRYKLPRERVENDDGHDVTSWRTHQRVLSAGAQPVLPYPA